ncbi:TPA: glycosyltransferase family 2 protein [Vibrio cholerae]|uniref:glycosyltransferase family 2 protein n=2 Tax=Vibrio cholerae TaxID=666 RepID=UPI001581A9EF|nr:glycosyltransferase family 2 protein [Vibrio cholerae]QKU79645.1 glycosyltransferase [Vibrio cholerae]
MINYRYEFYLERVDTVETVLLTRIRNESDIIEDFLNHVNDFSDGIIVFDDSSTDNTLDIVRNHPKVVAIVKNVSWDPHNRTKQETLHRKALNTVANKLFSPKWIIYMDADERLEGNIRQELAFIDNKKIDYIRIPLFDAYMTKNDCKDISPGETLLNRRLYYGPERRDIIFIWSGNIDAKFIKDDAREPEFDSNNYLTLFKCQHLGKALTVERWERKCDYYIANFPEVYAKKWSERKGKAIHVESDFGTPLYRWGRDLFENAILIHPI